MPTYKGKASKICTDFNSYDVNKLEFRLNANFCQSRNEDVLDLYEWCNDALDEGNKFPATEYALPAATKMADALRNKTLIITSNYKVYYFWDESISWK